MLVCHPVVLFLAQKTLVVFQIQTAAMVMPNILELSVLILRVLLLVGALMKPVQTKNLLNPFPTLRTRTLNHLARIQTHAR
ncbi:hypothetical protein KV36_17650 [Vibrio cholerae O1 biovar El Tor]|nr:hypothetical protein KV36_17650 [Vibrio cholerae O1 biovar El Tor]KUO30023.1 hypothetical protein AVO46_17010 [Vibrio cholerae]